jgi:hypothetical protein
MDNPLFIYNIGLSLSHFLLRSLDCNPAVTNNLEMEEYLAGTFPLSKTKAIKILNKPIFEVVKVL